MFGADSNCVNTKSDLLGKLSGFERLNFARRISTVGQQDQHLVAHVFLCLVHTTDGQRNRVANRRFLTGKTDERLHQQDVDGLSIERQGHLEIGALAEQNKADPVALATFNKITGNGFGCCQPVNSTTGKFEVFLVHAARQIYGQHQISARHRHVQFITNSFRSGSGEDQQYPGDRCQPESPVAQLLRTGSVFQR